MHATAYIINMIHRRNCFCDNSVINSKRKTFILVGVEVSPEVQTSIIISKRLLQIHMPAYNSFPFVSFPTEFGACKKINTNKAKKKGSILFDLDYRFDTLSSLNNDEDNCLIERAVSLEKRNPKRAAILIPRKMRAAQFLIMN